MSQDYKIPQNIDVEDKIFGPFTLRQFLYILAGGTIIYLLFLTLGTNINLFAMASGPVFILTVALVFVKVNDRPFLIFLGYFSSYLGESKLKKWDKATRIKMTMVQSEEETEQSRANIAISTKTGIVRSRLTQLATIVDTQGWSVGDNIEGGGRFISATNATLDAQASRSEGKLVDMFGDLEEAFEEVSASAPTRATPEDFSDLAANLSRLLSKQ